MTFTCTRCTHEKDGYPYGPINATWCWDCWREWQREVEQKAVEEVLSCCGEAQPQIEAIGYTSFAQALGDLSTAILLTERYDEDANSNLPRLYRIRNAMGGAARSFRLPLRIEV